jgi:hypothetical protein
MYGDVGGRCAYRTGDLHCVRTHRPFPSVLSFASEVNSKMCLVRSTCGVFRLRLGLTSSAQQLSKRLTNQDVVEMVAVGFSKIHATEGIDF